MLQAWQYAVSSVERGMTATEGYQDYYAGGGAIRTSDWYYLARQARESMATGDVVAGQPWATPIPGQAYTTSGYDYGEKYVTVADVQYFDLETEELVKRTVTVENDELTPWSETEDAIQDVVDRYGVLGGAAGVDIVRARFYTPSWTQE